MIKAIRVFQERTGCKEGWEWGFSHGAIPYRERPARTMSPVFDAGWLKRITPALLLIGVGLAVLLPIVPFALELMALRRLTAAAFGTLMALEPALALIVGLVVLTQVPGPAAAVGICLVVAAGVGAARSGARAELPVPAQVGS